MMVIIKKISLALVLICASCTNVKSLKSTGIPANLPPLTFAGKQFTDNEHCVFIRSGYNGKVTWVPRVDRSRNQLCDEIYKPTFGENNSNISIYARENVLTGNVESIIYEDMRQYSRGRYCTVEGGRVRYC